MLTDDAQTINNQTLQLCLVLANQFFERFSAKRFNADLNRNEVLNLSNYLFEMVLRSWVKPNTFSYWKEDDISIDLSLCTWNLKLIHSSLKSDITFHASALLLYLLEFDNSLELSTSTIWTSPEFLFTFQSTKSPN